VLDYLHEENDYGRKVMSSQQTLQDQLLNEMVQRIPQRDISAPWTKNGYRYRHIYEPGNEYPIYQRQSVLSAEWDEWDILLDANQRAAHSEFYTLGGMSISPDNAVMALAEDYLSRRQYGLRFAIWTPATGIRKCWKTSPRILSGRMIPRRCTTSKSTSTAALSGLAAYRGNGLR
jgi:oligopeptidase B